MNPRAGAAVVVHPVNVKYYTIQLTSVSQSDDGRGQGAAALDLFSASRTAAFAAALAGTSNS